MIKTDNELDAIRYRVKYQGVPMYIVLTSDKEGNLNEVFVTYDGPQLNPKRWAIHASIDSVTRLSSCLLRSGFGTDNLLKQLEKSSRSATDLPGLLAQCIRKHGYNMLRYKDAD